MSSLSSTHLATPELDLSPDTSERERYTPDIAANPNPLALRLNGSGIFAFGWHNLQLINAPASTADETDVELDGQSISTPHAPRTGKREPYSSRSLPRHALHAAYANESRSLQEMQRAFATLARELVKRLPFC